MTAVSVTLVGNLAGDPELRFMPSGKALVNFTVVTSKSYKDEATGEWQDKDTTFWRCTAWDRLAENIAETLQKGDPVIAQGSVAQRSYDTKEGEKRTVTEVTAWNVGPDLKKYAAKVLRVKRDAAPAGDPWTSTLPDDIPPF